MGVDLWFRDEQGAALAVPPFNAPDHRITLQHPIGGDDPPIDQWVEAELAITYNYGHVLHLLRDGITQRLPGYHEQQTFFTRFEGLATLFEDRSGTDPRQRKAGELIPALEYIVLECTGPMHNDYFAPTPGNVRVIMDVVLDWCRRYPLATIHTWC